MFFHPMDILSLVPIAEYANVPIWQHLRTYFYPMDMEVHGSLPILVRANGLVLQQLRMCKHPKDNFLHVRILIHLIDQDVQQLCM
jgi:hypothetical protein